jgi:hypothetical protein
MISVLGLGGVGGDMQTVLTQAVAAAGAAAAGERAKSVLHSVM